MWGVVCLSKKEKRLLKRIIIAGIIFIIAIPLHYRKAWSLGFLSIDNNIIKYVELLIFLISYFIVGWDILSKAFKNIKNGQLFDENFLMTVATIGAFFLGEFPEGVAVMLFYQIGELFQSYAVSRSRRSIADLMDICPEYANIKSDDGIRQVSPEEVSIDDIIIVKPGERMPLDGVIIDGSSSLDTSALTGESVPRDVYEGEQVISGCINQTGVLTVKVTKVYSESTVAKILELVENASDNKSRSENFITKFARYYTPFVVISAVLLSILPPIILNQSFLMWIERALTFLVISCPCALVISVPLSFFGGIGGASKSGVLVKGSNYLEVLSKAKTVVFDKTGTLTKGNFAVENISPQGIKANELLELAAYAENYSDHPIAMSIKRKYGKDIDISSILDLKEIAGHGVKAVIKDKDVLVGNKRLMDKFSIPINTANDDSTVVYVAVNGKFAGYISIVDEVKPDSKLAVSQLKKLGIDKTIILTGDSDAVGQKVVNQLGIDKAYTELLPASKVEIIEELLNNSVNGSLVFVGDGINDAPALARADIGIAMGGMGSDAAIEAADIVIMTDEPSKIATVMKISKKTLRIVKQNIVFALAVKSIVLVLGALGYASMWAAVFADVGVSIIAILNAIRALNVRKFNQSK